MKTILLIRKTKDYKLDPHWSNTTRGKFKLWNETFTIPYFEIRKRLHRIAFQDIDKMGFDEIFWHYGPKILDYIVSRKDTWVVPIDDDDWLSYNIATILKTHNVNQQICYWDVFCADRDSVKNQKPIIEKKNMINLRFALSCGYAVNTNIKTKDKCLLLDHMKTLGRKGSFSKEILSVHVRHPASVFFLTHNNKKGMIDMWKGMRLIDVDTIDEQFKDKMIALKKLFESCKLK